MNEQVRVSSKLPAADTLVTIVPSVSTPYAG
jgi:hypothetical protein